MVMVTIIALLFTACSSPVKGKADPVAANIKMHTHTWDQIINEGKLDLFNDSNFTKDVVMYLRSNLFSLMGKQVTTAL